MKGIKILIVFLFYSLPLLAQVGTGVENSMEPRPIHSGREGQIRNELFSGPEIPPTLPEPGSVPIDGGVLGLLTLGAGFGVKKIRNFINNPR